MATALETYHACADVSFNVVKVAGCIVDGKEYKENAAHATRCILCRQVSTAASKVDAFAEDAHCALFEIRVRISVQLIVCKNKAFCQSRGGSHCKKSRRFGQMQAQASNSINLGVCPIYDSPADTFDTKVRVAAQSIQQYR